MQNIIATRTSTHPQSTRPFVLGLALAAAAAVAAVAIAVAPSLTLTNVATVPAYDSYTQVEAIRGGAFSGSAADGSLDLVEKTRGAAFGSTGIVAVDESYDDIERLRSQR